LSCEAIRHGGFSGWEALDRVPNLISTEGRIQVIKVGRLNQVCQAQHVLVLNIRAQQSIEVLECGLNHVSVISQNLVLDCHAMHVIFLAAVGALPVEEGSLGVSILQHNDVSALASDVALVRHLDLFVQPALFHRQSSILYLVEPKQQQLT
jgi:hypothetical protein